MERKPIQVSEEVWDAIRTESFRLSAKLNRPVTMGDVIERYTKKLLGKKEGK